MKRTHHSEFLGLDYKVRGSQPLGQTCVRLGQDVANFGFMFRGWDFGHGKMLDLGLESLIAICACVASSWLRSLANPMVSSYYICKCNHEQHSRMITYDCISAAYISTYDRSAKAVPVLRVIARMTVRGSQCEHERIL